MPENMGVAIFWVAGNVLFSAYMYKAVRARISSRSADSGCIPNKSERADVINIVNNVFKSRANMKSERRR